MASVLLAVLLAFPAVAEPALWIIHGTGSTIYLFGTVHALKPSTVWFSPKIRHAFEGSQDLWLEVSDIGAPETKSLIARLGVDPAHPLSQQLPLADQARLDHAAKLAGLPGAEMMEPMRPWFAALAIAAAPIFKAGYQPDSGVDKTLQGKAMAAGKPIRGFETTEQQLHFLADLSQNEQLDLLHEALDDADKGAKKLDPMIDAWVRGDTLAFARIENDDLRMASTVLYRKLIVNRDTLWAKRLAAMTHEPGTHFVAVGAAHLVGPDSVQKALATYGIAAERAP